jgi:hypothetical protein
MHASSDLGLLGCDVHIRDHLVECGHLSRNGLRNGMGPGASSDRRYSIWPSLAVPLAPRINHCGRSVAGHAEKGASHAFRFALATINLASLALAGHAGAAGG